MFATPIPDLLMLLKSRIQAEIGIIRKGNVAESLRFQTCIETDDHHLPKVIFK